MDRRSIVSENLARVRERIGIACQNSGRQSSEIQLIAVTKSVGPETIRLLLELGIVDLGENRPQALLEKSAALPFPEIRWHLIGHLQRNKARKVVALTSLIHSGDSLRLLSNLDALAGELGLMIRLLIEVNISGDKSKHGFEPEELRRASMELERFQNLQIQGLMGMSGLDSDPGEKLGQFASLRELRDELRGRNASLAGLTELSMGMSDDFELAIHEGATMVRIGSALFEGLAAEFPG